MPLIMATEKKMEIDENTIKTLIDKINELELKGKQSDSRIQKISETSKRLEAENKRINNAILILAEEMSFTKKLDLELKRRGF